MDDHSRNTFPSILQRMKGLAERRVGGEKDLDRSSDSATSSWCRLGILVTFGWPEPVQRRFKFLPVGLERGFNSQLFSCAGLVVALPMVLSLRE